MARRAYRTSVATTDHDSLVGRTVGQYQILARIGGGGMGVVYTARASRLGRVVALKFLPPQWSDDESAKQRFVREAQAASATNHPNICTIHDIETADDGQLFIVMAYYDGATLKKRLESGPLPIDEALDIATQISEGLAKAHAQGVVHRDIKPGNIILTDDGVRILDFGLATFVDALKLTIENAPLGTVAYMSPEQVRGLPADARTDVWATGVVLYEMLTGHPPFRGSHTEAIGYAVRNEAPSPIGAERPEVPEEVEQLVFRALHKEPGIRYQSGRDLARALRHIRGLSIPVDLITQRLHTPDVKTPMSTRRRRTPLLAAVLLAMVVAIGWLAWPVTPVTVAVAFASNQTGRTELDASLPALTAELSGQLAGVEGVRVIPYDRILQITRRFRAEAGSASGRDALQSIAQRTGARVLVMPTIAYADGAWHVRIEFRNPDTGTTRGVFATTPEKSSLMNDVVYRHVASASIGIADYFARSESLRTALRAQVRHWMRLSPGRASPRFRTLDAARSFELGLDA